MTRKFNSSASGKNVQVELLRVPHPYRAMIAISSDCDGMSLATFEHLHQFFNTREETRYGEGLGLDIADSVWVYTPVADAQPLRDRGMSLKAGTAPESPEDMADTIAHYIEAGWVDTLHSLGNFSRGAKFGDVPTAAHAAAAVRLFKQLGIRLPVWVNHGNNSNIQNIGTRDYMRGGRSGDELFAFPYVQELGVRYINAQEYPMDRELREIEPLVFGKFKTWSFSRWYCIPWIGEKSPDVLRYLNRRGQLLSYVWHPTSLQYQLNETNLDKLVASGGFGIFAQHLGYRVGVEFPTSAVNALRCLKTYQDRGEILVARTSRLLNYKRAIRNIRYGVQKGDSEIGININSIIDETVGEERATLDDARGLSFKISNWTGPIVIKLHGRPLPSEEIVVERTGDAEQIAAVRWFKEDVRAHHRITPAERRRYTNSAALSALDFRGSRDAQGRTGSSVKLIVTTKRICALPRYMARRIRWAGIKVARSGFGKK